MARPRYRNVYRTVRDTVQAVPQLRLHDTWEKSDLAELQLCCVDSRYWALPLATW